LEELTKAENQKRSKDPKRNKKEKRSSVTDPESRVMMMADGGFRPAYNVHLATVTGAGVVVAVEVNNEGTDQTTMVSLAEQIEQRHQARPTEWLADNGCTSLRNINEMGKRGSKVYAPVRVRSRLIPPSLFVREGIAQRCGNGARGCRVTKPKRSTSCVARLPSG